MHEFNFRVSRTVCLNVTLRWHFFAVGISLHSKLRTDRWVHLGVVIGKIAASHRGQCVRPRTDSPGICLSFRHTLGTTRVMLQNAFFRWSNIKHYNLLGHTHTSWIFSSTHYLTNLTDQNLWMCMPHTLHEISRIKRKSKRAISWNLSTFRPH